MRKILQTLFDGNKIDPAINVLVNVSLPVKSKLWPEYEHKYYQGIASQIALSFKELIWCVYMIVVFVSKDIVDWINEKITNLTNQSMAQFFLMNLTSVCDLVYWTLPPNKTILLFASLPLSSNISGYYTFLSLCGSFNGFDLLASL